MAETSQPVLPHQSAVQPNFGLLDARIADALDKRLLAHGGGGGNIGGMAHDERVSKLEIELGTIKGSLDWAKIVVSIVSALMLGGFAVLITINLNLSAKIDAQTTAVSAKIDAISTSVTQELRAQRADQSAQISAVTNAITAAQQKPVILIPPASSSPSTTDP